MTSLVLGLLVLVPAVVGGLLALTAALPRRGNGPAEGAGHGRGRPLSERAAGVVGVGTALVTLVLSAVAASTRPSVQMPFLDGLPLGLRVDGLASVMAPTVATVTLLVLVFSLGAADGELTGEVGASRARFSGLMLIFAAAALVTATATTLTTLLLAWELMGAMSWALIGFRWDVERHVQGGLTALVTTRTADLGLYVAAGAALAGGAGLGLDALADASPGWRHVIAAGVLVAGLGKAAQLPFSFWLSRAMEGPSPVSALLHSAAMVALGGFLLLRVQPLLAATGWAGSAAAWVGVLTAAGLGLVACFQRDLKQLLAASTGAQLGFVVMAAGLPSLAGGMAQLVAHAATKALLFLAAGVWLGLLGTRQLDQLHGVARRWPAVGWAATVGAVSLAGVAPLSLWATKDAILGASLSSAQPASPALYAVGLVAAALSAAYSARILAAIWGLSSAPRADAGPTTGTGTGTGTATAAGAAPGTAAGSAAGSAAGAAPGTGRPGLDRTVPLLVLAVGAATLGVLALPPAEELLAETLGTAAAAANVALLTVSALAAAVVLVAVLRRGIPDAARSRLGASAASWLGLERAAYRLVVAPAFWLAGLLARFDDGVLDRVPDLAAAGARRVARDLSGLDLDVVDAGVERLAVAVRRLGQRARRPQTGQLYQYYLQAVVVVALAVVLLVSSVVVR